MGLQLYIEAPRAGPNLNKKVAIVRRNQGANEEVLPGVVVRDAHSITGHMMIRIPGEFVRDDEVDAVIAGGPEVAEAFARHPGFRKTWSSVRKRERTP